MRLPYLKATRQQHDVQDVFLGYNHNTQIKANEFFDMQNIAPNSFPMFAPRAPRATVATLNSAQGLISRDALVYVDGDSLYINYNKVIGLVLTTSPKTLISMGAYVIIMPDKKYVNTEDTSDKGSIESLFSLSGSITFTPAKADGNDLGTTYVGVEPPVEPINGQYWVDTSKLETHILRQYSSISSVWVEVLTTFTKITATGIGAYFKQNDAVQISGCTFGGTDAAAKKQIADLNGSKIISQIGDNFIVVPGLLSTTYTQTGATFAAKRKMPSMDFIIESENRLWGCKYGIVDGKTINEIYACALGDFKNWSRYSNISTDSYAASVGTDGKFTGAITYLGYPLFFKESCMHKVYGNFPSNYRIDTIECRGVQEGSGKSLAVVNELLFYKGRTEVLAYDGSLPVGVSEALGGKPYGDAVAGSFKDRYYISMKTGNTYTLFFYDTQKRLWYKEDNTQVTAFAAMDSDLFMLTGNKIIAEFGTTGTLDGAVIFSATSGIIGYHYTNRKYISRLNVRAKLPVSSTLRISFRYDSTGDFMEAGRADGAGFTKTIMMPLKPKRCDHFEMKIEGTGAVEIFSIAKILEVGGDGA